MLTLGSLLLEQFFEFESLVTQSVKLLEALFPDLDEVGVILLLESGYLLQSLFVLVLDDGLTFEHIFKALLELLVGLARPAEGGLQLIHPAQQG